MVTTGRPSLVMSAFSAEFARYRQLAERATAQLSWEQVRVPLDPETNSIAVVVKHIGGNLRSRWTEPFTTDGEKPWRNRDDEFVGSFSGRPAAPRNRPARTSRDAPPSPPRAPAQLWIGDGKQVVHIEPELRKGVTEGPGR